jgi:hypothetical protein
MASSSAQRGQRSSGKQPPRTFAPPVMRVTRYDRVSSFMMSLIMGTIAAVGFVVLQWYAIRKDPPMELVPLEMVVGGGYEDGNPDETLQVESPEEVNPNASPVDEQVEQEELMEVLENVVELSDRATKQVQQVQASTESTGTPGSAVGTGGRPLGSGGGAGGGIPAYQRWYIRFNESSSTEYAKQLDHFGIELAVFFPGSGKVSYAKGFSSGAPSPYHKTKWEDDRIYFKWSGGPRERIDRELLQKAKIDAAGGQIFQFYPDQTIQLLGTLEQNYANRSAKEIRRTYFVVTPQGGGYTFTVTRQTYLK